MSTLETKGRAAGVYFTADMLVGTYFPPIRWAVHGLISEGLSVFAGPQKVGKSCLILGVCVAVAEGGKALGRVDVEPGDVLYAALEDSPRRLKHRLGQVLAGRPAPARLTIVTALPSMPQATELISEWLDEHPDARLVVVDVLAKVRPQGAPGADRYEADYRVMSELKRLADHHGVAVVVVTHTRKLGADDVFDTVSGSVGLTGAADSTIVLRRARNDTAGSLSITGRDVPESEYAVQFDGEHMTWTLDGQELADAARKAAETRATVGLGDRSAEIVAYVNTQPDGVRAADVEQALELPDARRYLARLADSDRITKTGRGLYKGCVPSVPSVPLPLVDGTHGTHGTPTCGECGEPLDALWADVGLCVDCDGVGA
ncbi:hypothetical protein BH11ACT1_BH11ACT1_19310 [soil metagenome]